MNTAPHIIIGHDETACAAIAADVIDSVLAARPDALITLPTGKTPLALYRLLASGRRDAWKHVRFIALDEYCGLGDDDPRLFGAWIARECLDPMGITAERRTMFRSNAPDPVTECARVATWLDAHGPLDLAVLGLGTNGHLAFNEPGADPAGSVHVATLAAESITANAGYWGGADRVPRTGMTLGLGDIMRARKIILLVSGAHKAAILDRALHGPVDPAVPASILQTHGDVAVIADAAAAGGQR